MKRILSLYDYSGRWSQPYRDAGYEVIQVDIEYNLDAVLWPSPPANTMTGRRYNYHLEDIHKHRPIHGILAAPPCTNFAIAGANVPRNDDELRAGLSLVDVVFRLMWVLDPNWWVIENPPGKLRKWLGEPSFNFKPYEFGGWNPDPDVYDRSTKRTCLWGYFTIPTRNPIKSNGRSYGQLERGGSNKRTKQVRSMTPIGFANAFFEANP